MRGKQQCRGSGTQRQSENDVQLRAVSCTTSKAGRHTTTRCHRRRLASHASAARITCRTSLARRPRRLAASHDRSSERHCCCVAWLLHTVHDPHCRSQPTAAATAFSRTSRHTPSKDFHLRCRLEPFILPHTSTHDEAQRAHGRPCSCAGLRTAETHTVSRIPTTVTFPFLASARRAMTQPTASTKRGVQQPVAPLVSANVAD